jgi:hypothetical protein
VGEVWLQGGYFMEEMERVKEVTEFNGDSHLAESAGEKVPLKSQGDFQRCPHLPDRSEAHCIGDHAAAPRGVGIPRSVSARAMAA